MKNKDIEKNIRNIVSPAKDEIWGKIEKEVFADAPVSLQTVAQTGNGSAALRNNRGFIYALCAAFIALIIAAAIIIPKLFNKPLDYSGSFFIDINPSVQVVVGSDGNVTEIVPLNDDALVLLEGLDASYVGKTCEEAALCVWETAYKTGYISPIKKNSAILVTGALANESLNAELSEKIKSYLVTEIKNKGVYCAVLTEVLDASVKTEADGYGISASKYQLIKSACETGVEISETEYKTITVTEINNRITEYGKKLDDLGGTSNSEAFEEVRVYINEATKNIISSLRRFVSSIRESALLLPLVESELGNLENILGEMERCVDNGGDIEDFFERLNTSLEDFPEINIIKDSVEDLQSLLEDFSKYLKNFSVQIVDAKTQILKKYNDYISNAEEIIRDYIKSDDFDDDYESWLESVYDDYRENWKARKTEWKRDFN